MVASEHLEIAVHGLVLVFERGGDIGNDEKAYIATIVGEEEHQHSQKVKRYKCGDEAVGILISQCISA